MSDQPHFEKAPIQEAIIDIRLHPAEEVSLATLRRVRDRLQNEYPSEAKVVEQQVEFRTDPSGVQASASERGFLLTSSDNRQINQITLDGFAFSLLEPYSTWEDFISAAHSAWQVYSGEVAVSRFGRIAVRFINRFDFQEKKIDLQDYFTLRPEFPSSIGEPLIGYGLRIAVSAPDIQGIIAIAQNPIPPRHEEGVSLLLDIDVSRNQDLPQAADEIWTILQQFRAIKNKVFVSCLTDKTRKMISS